MPHSRSLQPSCGVITNRLAPVFAMMLALGALPQPLMADGFFQAGNGWSATIGEDGLLRSIKIGETEMLQDFPGRSNACVIFSSASREFLPPFEKVERTTNGTIRAAVEKLELEYAFGPDEVRIRFLSRVKDQEVFHMYLRPSTAVTQALAEISWMRSGFHFFPPSA